MVGTPACAFTTKEPAAPPGKVLAKPCGAPIEYAKEEKQRRILAVLSCPMAESLGGPARLSAIRPLEPTRFCEEPQEQPPEERKSQHEDEDVLPEADGEEADQGIRKIEQPRIASKE